MHGSVRPDAREVEVLPSFDRWFEDHGRDFDALVLDIDGILVLGGKPMPGSIEFLEKLRRRDYPFSLLTNDGNHSIVEKRRHLRRCGLHLNEDELTSCADGLMDLGIRLGLKGKRFFVMGDLGRPSYAVRAGFRVTRSLSALSCCEGVIVGEANYDWEPVINGVVNYFISHPRNPFIVPNPDEFYPCREGLRIAAGGIARFVQRVLSVHDISIEPTYLGKPHEVIFEHNHGLMERRWRRKFARNRVLMLGDSLASDVQGATDYGYRSALFLTGVTTETNLRCSALKPDYVFQGY